MDLPVKIEHVELVGRGADVTLAVPVGLENPVDLADHEIVPYVKFSPFEEEGTVYVQLNDKSFLSAVIMFLLCFYDGI